MEGGKKELSFWVFVGFLLLFLVFMVVGPDRSNTSNAIIGSTALGESPSVVTLVVLFVVLIVVLAGVFIMFRKFKKKKSQIESPKPVQDDKKEPKAELGEGDIDKLFSDEEKKLEEPRKEIKKEIPVEKFGQPKKKEILTNLQDLKNKIKGMLTQKLTKEQIVGSLKSQGVNVDQITKAMEEVNIDNVREYVTQALKQGFSRDQIVRNLAVHGWKKEQISRVI